jgi:hypothetical protein
MRISDPERRQPDVRESQVAVFVNEGQIADVFGPGTHKLTTQTLPLLTNLKNWDKLFASPFKSDVLQHARADRPQMGHAAADHHPRQGLRHGARARLRHVLVPRADAAPSSPKSAARARYTRDEVEDQLRGILMATMASSLGGASALPRHGGQPGADGAAGQGRPGQAFARYGMGSMNSTWPASACRKNCRRRWTNASRPA